MDNLNTKIAELKSCIGKTDKVSRKRFNELIAELEEHSDDARVQEALHNLMSEGMDETRKEIAALREQISPVYDILPLSYIAENYFKKSRAWLYQRLNGLEVRGHVYTLNDEQKQIFNLACQDIAKRIGSVCLV